MFSCWPYTGTSVDSMATIIIEPDHPRVIMVWQTSLAPRAEVDYSEETVVREKRHI